MPRSSRILALATILATLALHHLAHAYSPITMICLVNEERARRGLKPLGMDSRLENAAQGHSDWQAKRRSMSHTGVSGSDPGVRVTEAGYDWITVAENLAYGYSDEQEAMDMWMQSPGHKANILGKSYTHMGSAAAYASDGTAYYTQDFGSDGSNLSYPDCPSGYNDSPGRTRQPNRGGGARGRYSDGSEDNDDLLYYDDDSGNYIKYDDNNVVYFYDSGYESKQWNGSTQWGEWETDYGTYGGTDSGGWEYDNGDPYAWKRK